MEEEWRHVKGFMMYEISNHGRLRRASYMQVYKNGKFKIYEPYVHSETNAKVIIFVLFCEALDTAEEVAIYIGLLGSFCRRNT